MKRALELCFDRRVLVGLGVLAAGIWLFAPQLLPAALPMLVLLACPLSMVLMMWMMRGEMGKPTSASTTPGVDRLSALEQEQARLANEIAQARREVEAASGPRSA